MRIQTIHRNQMGDVFNECSAHGFQITTADGGRITIMVDGDGLARAEPPSAPVVGGLIDAAKAAESMLRTVHECASHDCEDCREHAGIHAKHLRDALAQQPAAEPKTLPVPTRVYLIGETAVIAGTPQRGWDEEGPDAHNCDDMGCSTFGRHVLARVPFTDERALPTQQGGGEINMDVTVRDGAWVGTYAEWCRRKHPAAVAVDKPIPETVLDRACDAYEQIADDCMGLVRRKAMRAALTVALGDARRLVGRLAAHVRPTCSELWDEAQAFLAAEDAEAGEVDCRCIDCGGNQPDHDPTCSYMHELHGEQPEARGVVDGWRLVVRYCEYDNEPGVWAEKDGSLVWIAALTGECNGQG